MSDVARRTAPRAIAIVRNAFEHDARVLRVARTLRAIGYDPLVVAAVTAPGQPEHTCTYGIPVRRVPQAAWVAALQHRLGGHPLTRRSEPSHNGTPRSAGQLVRVVALHTFRNLRSLGYYRRATSIVLRERPAILHCNDYNTMWVGVGAKALIGTRLVYDAHELWPDRNGRWEWRPWLLAAEFIFARVADQVVTVSPGIAQCMTRRYRIRPPAVVRNVPADGVSPTAHSRPRAEAPSAVYVGHLLVERGLEQAIDAAALVSNLLLRLIGPGSPGMIEMLRERALEAGIQDRLEIVGPVPPDAVVATLGGASLGLSLFQPTCLSHSLTLPNKIMEYVAAGVPVLTSDVESSAEFVRRHDIGEIAPASDPAAIAAAMRRLLDPERNAEVRAHLAALAPQNTWSAERQRLVEVYHAALG